MDNDPAILLDVLGNPRCNVVAGLSRTRIHGRFELRSNSGSGTQTG
jgi:hypothetical protein